MAVTLICSGVMPGGSYVRAGGISTTGYSWDDVHDSPSGSSGTDYAGDPNWPSTSDYYAVTAVRRGGAGACALDRGYEIYRSFILFDTSDITVAPASATLNLTPKTGYPHYNMSSSLGIIAVKATFELRDGQHLDRTAGDAYGPTPGTDYISLDGWQDGFNNTHLTAYSDPFTTWTSADETSGQNQLVLTSDALSDMANLDELKICLMTYKFDYLDQAPHTVTDIDYYDNDCDAGTAHDPNIVNSYYYYNQNWVWNNRSPRIVYVTGSAAGDGDGPYRTYSTYENYIDLQDMTGSSAPTNKGAVHIMSGSLRTSSGLVISGSSTYAINIAANSGSIRADEFVTYSDWGLKTNIKPMENSLNKIMKLESVSYDKIASGKKEVGFIAQDVAKVIPEVCALDGAGEGRGVDYSRISALVADGIKEQQQKLKAQQERLAKLKAKIEELKK